MWLRILIHILKEMFLLLSLKKTVTYFLKASGDLIWHRREKHIYLWHLWLIIQTLLLLLKWGQPIRTALRTAGVSEGLVWGQERVAACLQLHPCFMSPFTPTDSWTHIWAVAAGVSVFTARQCVVLYAIWRQACACMCRVLVEVASLPRADWGVVNLWTVASEGVST